METKKIIIIFIVLFVLLVGASIFLYFQYKPPFPLIEEKYYNLHLRALDENNIQYPQDFIIILDDDRRFEVSGVEEGYKIIKLPILHSFDIFNKNNNKFYVNKGIIPWGASALENKDYKLDFPLTTIGKLAVNVTGKLDGKEIFLNITGVGEVRNVDFCVRWGSGLKRVYSNYSDLVISKYLENKVDKCFKTQTTLKTNENLGVFLYYDFYFLEDQEIIVYLVDGDLDINNEVYVKEIDNKNVGAEDFIINIK